ncbi:response regulator transcription factor [Gilvimarinus polysaccharolyticus]|uniref:response regulator transcription factor n=1 Tax=Gilvimarinus polysaccharolyticus TaxID=863921 RepID=UPI0006736A4A|nr:response regulator transcription factor [Gilvimarinus polysaccharolyticus]
MTNPNHFLIVDDDTVFAAALQRSLIRRGYNADVAHSAAATQQCAQTQAYHYAIVDLKLGDDSGLEVIKLLLQAQPSVVIVVLTGYSSIATAVQAIKLGAKNYLCKPADTDELLSALGISAASQPTIPDRPPSVDRVAWEHIQKVLLENNGNVSATARSLGMHRRTLQRKLTKRPVKS